MQLLIDSIATASNSGMQLLIIIDSIQRAILAHRMALITACQNCSLYRDYINNCVPEWLAVRARMACCIESILITACQNGSL